MNKNFTYNITKLILMLFLIASCDCYQQIAGKVIDKETGKPLQGVTVYTKNKSSNKILTDSTGNFELSDISGGFRCPPMTIIVENENYKLAEKRIPTGGYEVIKLQKK